MEAQTSVVDQRQVAMLASAAAGDEIAFRRIVAEHHDDMRKVCLAIADDRSIADEATQAAWVIAWKRLGDVREIGHLRTGRQRPGDACRRSRPRWAPCQSSSRSDQQTRCDASGVGGAGTHRVPRERRVPSRVADWVPHEPSPGRGDRTQGIHQQPERPRILHP